MTKKIYITSGSAGNGKDTFARLVGKYARIKKYSSIDLVKEMFESIGIDRHNKNEKKRKLYSDAKDMLTWYDDIPFKDIGGVVKDFNKGEYDADVLFIDIREPEEIARAAKEFGAKTILIRNPNVAKVESNHADANVENYNYDYIIENDGTLEQFETVAKLFVRDVIWQDNIPSLYKTFTFVCSRY